MADFCFQCSIDMYFGPPGDLAGLCEEGQFARVICEGCGLVRVNHQGWCISSCFHNHQEPPPGQLEVLRSVWREWERRSGPLGWVYRLRDRWLGSPWEPGIWSDFSIWYVRLIRSLWDGDPMYMYEPDDFLFTFEENDGVIYGHEGLPVKGPLGEEPASTGTRSPSQDDQGPQGAGVVGR